MRDVAIGSLVSKSPFADLFRTSASKRFFDYQIEALETPSI